MGSCRCFLRILLVSALLFLCFSQGFGIKFTRFEKENSTLDPQEVVAREMIEVMDYQDPGPNTNPRTGYLVNPTPPTPAPQASSDGPMP